MSVQIKNPDAPMTFKQGLMIRNLGGGDVRGENLTQAEASKRIETLLGDRVITKKTKGDSEFKGLWDKAKKAGIEAGNQAGVTPMVVTERHSPLDDRSPVKKQYFVSEGACGFAWVTVKPANSAFAKWLVRNNHGRVSSEGGVKIWISEHNQSVDRKSAHAYSLAQVLVEAGIRAYSDSRLD